MRPFVNHPMKKFFDQSAKKPMDKGLDRLWACVYTDSSYT